MRIRIHYDEAGNIVTILQIKKGKNVPQVDIQTIPDSRSFEIELSRDLAKLSLLDIHTKYKVDLERKELHLVPIISNKGRTSERRKSY